MVILKYAWLLFPVLGWAQISEPSISTFSIVARDQQTGELGVAVQSKFIAVGSVVPYAQADVGAIASQAWGNTRYGPVGLDLLARGRTAEEVVHLMTEADPNREHRQLAVIGTEGNASIFTGKECKDWAGGKTGVNYAVQGNLLTGAECYPSDEYWFWFGRKDDCHAGQQAGGDKRGKQSAALLIVKSGWGYGGLSDRFRDLRVDDHPSPVKELERIYYLHRDIFHAQIINKRAIF